MRGRDAEERSRPRWRSRCARGTVRAEGDIDFRGTLGVDRAAPVGFRAIRARDRLDTDAPQEKVDKLLQLTERYCVVFQTLAGQPQLSIKATRG